MSPKAVERPVLRFGAPFAIDCRQFAVEFQRAPLLGGLERVEIAYLVRRIDVSAAAVTDIERVDLTPAENRDPVVRSQRQDSVVAQQHYTVRCRSVRKLRHPGQVVFSSSRRVAFLRDAVVLDRLRDLHSEFEHPSHHISLLSPTAAPTMASFGRATRQYLPRSLCRLKTYRTALSQKTRRSLRYVLFLRYVCAYCAKAALSSTAAAIAPVNDLSRFSVSSHAMCQIMMPPSPRSIA